MQQPALSLSLSIFLSLFLSLSVHNYVSDGENSDHHNTVNSAAGEEIRGGLSVSLLLDPPKYVQTL